MTPPRSVPWFLVLPVSLGLLYLCCAAVLFVLMRQSNTVAGKTLALVPKAAFKLLPLETMWCEARDGSLEVGQLAPDFELDTRDGTGRVRLSAVRKSGPVVLVFGSYTCPPFRREMPAINVLAEQYQDRAAFYFVYIEEAHAHDVWPLPVNAEQKVDYSTPHDLADRTGVANTCASSMKIEFPMLVDDLNNAVGNAYTAWPTRLYVIDRDGKIAWKSRVGPFGFEASALAAALARL